MCVQNTMLHPWKQCHMTLIVTVCDVYTEYNVAPLEAMSHDTNSGATLTYYNLFIIVYYV